MKRWILMAALLFGGLLIATPRQADARWYPGWYGGAYYRPYVGAYYAPPAYYGGYYGPSYYQPYQAYYPYRSGYVGWYPGYYSGW
jgi:hypothetical protein